MTAKHKLKKIIETKSQTIRVTDIVLQMTSPSMTATSF